MCVCVCASPLNHVLTLCYRMDCSLPVSAVHGVFQERMLEWGAIFFSSGSFPPRNRTQVSGNSCACRQILYLLNPCKSCSNYHFHCQTQAITIVKYVYNFALILHIALLKTKHSACVYCVLHALTSAQMDVCIYSSATCLFGSEFHP